MTRKSPHDIADILHRFYKEHPERWHRGFMGNMQVGCCLMGGTYDITQDLTESVMFFREFKRITGHTVVRFNDQIAQNVNDIVDALSKVEVNTR